MWAFPLSYLLRLLKERLGVNIAWRYLQSIKRGEK